MTHGKNMAAGVAFASPCWAVSPAWTHGRTAKSR